MTARRLRVFSYVCADADCPPELNTVAHDFGQDGPGKPFQLRLATQVGSDPSACAKRLSALLQAEITREGHRARKAWATGERVRSGRGTIAPDPRSLQRGTESGEGHSRQRAARFPFRKRVPG